MGGGTALAWAWQEPDRFEQTRKDIDFPSVLKLAVDVAASLVTPYVDSVAPTAVNGLVATARERSIRLDWQPAGDHSGVPSYQVQSATSATGPWQTIGRTTTTAFIHKALPDAQQRFYRVIPVDAAGNNGPAGVAVGATVKRSTSTDANGDGKDDVVTFTRGSLTDVFVSRSDGTRPAPGSRPRRSGTTALRSTRNGRSPARCGPDHLSWKNSTSNRAVAFGWSIAGE